MQPARDVDPISRDCKQIFAQFMHPEELLAIVQTAFFCFFLNSLFGFVLALFTLFLGLFCLFFSLLPLLVGMFFLLLDLFSAASASGFAASAGTG